MKDKRLLTIFLIVFIDLLGFGIVLPLLPFIAERYQANEFQIGLLTAVYSFFQFVSAPILGRLSDRYGRKKLLIISQIGTLFGFLLLGLANSLPLLFISRIIDGITGGNISIAQAYIADITDKNNRAKGMGVLGAAFGLGFIFGPALGGILSRFGFATPAYFAAVVSLVSIIATTLFLTETVDVKKAQKSKYTKMNFAEIMHVLKTYPIGPLIIIFALLNLAFSAMQGTFALFTERSFHFGPTETGYLFTVVGLVAVATQLWILPRLLKRYSEKSLLLTGIIAMTIGLLLIPLSLTPLILMLPMIFLPFGNGLMTPTLNAIASETIRKEEYGETLGILNSGASLGRIIGPIVGGELLYLYGKNVPFIFAGALCLLIAFYTGRVLYKKQI
jgi:DHA1 family tetracycline resistance protein-like MFS transporter